MTVGDGTWDFTKNSFLLPNLVGLNFETMQYNGMSSMSGAPAALGEQQPALVIVPGIDKTTQAWQIASLL